MDRREQGRTPASVQEAADTNIVETIYDIRNESGHLVARHVRRDKPGGAKDVRWRQPDGAWGLNGTPLADLPLYGSELVDDCYEDELIVVVEGEKARDALEDAGVPALGTVTGAAGTPGPEALEVVRNRRVCLWPDNDDPGRNHMERIAERLDGVATEILIYTWDESPEKGDAADHPAIQSRNPKAVDQLLTDLEDAPRWKSRVVSEANDADDPTSATPSTPIFTELPTAMVFPVEALPVSTRRFVKEASRATGCPPDLVAVPTLAMLSAGIGASRVVRLKRTWSESTALFLVVVASPGSKKTPAQRIATEPVWAEQAELTRKYRMEREAYVAECRRWEADKRKTREDERPDPEPPDEPVMGRTVVEDATVEALYSVLEESPRGVLDIEDELSGWVRRMDQYKGGKGADRQFFLRVWGNSPVVVDRKGKGEPTIIHRPWLSLIGSIQPTILWEVAAKREDGMLDRFLCSYPDAPPVPLSDYDVSQEASDQVRGLYDKLANLEMREGENGEPVPGVVNMAPDAWGVFKELSHGLMAETHAPGFPARLQGVWSKLEAYLARLSLILALCRVAEQDGEELVQTRDVVMASGLIDYFKAHAHRVHVGLHGTDSQDVLAKDLATLLRERGGEWKDEASVLHTELRNRGCEVVPNRPDELSKMVLAISAQETWLKAEPGWKKNDEGKSRRAIHLCFKNGVDGVVGVDLHRE